MGSIAPFVPTFGYNPRSELTNAQPDDATYAYNYDNIGKTPDGCKGGWTCGNSHAPRRGKATMRCRRINRITAQEAAEQMLKYFDYLNKIPGSNAIKQLGYTSAPEVGRRKVKLKGETYKRVCAQNET